MNWLTFKTQFEAQYHFPCILGVIDGTHIVLTALPLEIEDGYVNRKGFHSINAQVVCDASMLILNSLTMLLLMVAACHILALKRSTKMTQQHLIFC